MGKSRGIPNYAGPRMVTDRIKFLCAVIHMFIEAVSELCAHFCNTLLRTDIVTDLSIGNLVTMNIRNIATINVHSTYSGIPP